MGTAYLYGYKEAKGQNGLLNGAEDSVSTKGEFINDKLLRQYSMWMDATEIKNLDTKKIDSVTLMFYAKASKKNDLAPYSFLKCKSRVSGSSSDKTSFVQTEKLPTSYKSYSFNLGTWTKEELTTGSNIHIYLQVYSSNFSTSPAQVTYIKDVKVKVNYTLNTYTINVKASGGGTVSGGGTGFLKGDTITISATPAVGYRFIQWSDGSTEPTRTITVNGNATYTAVFKKIVYVTYDNLFNFTKWAEAGIKAGNGITISNLTDIGFTGTATVDDAYTNQSPVIPVVANSKYIFQCDTSASEKEFFIFNTDSNGSWSGSDFSYNTQNSFEFTPTKNYISLRCDVVGTGKVVNFSNFRIYPYGYEYMSSTLDASQRVNTDSWNIPTPKEREGYYFSGWNTQPDGSGVTYTSESQFPTDDLVLYSYWKPIYKVTTSIIGKGTVSSSSTEIIEGENLTLTLSPEQYYGIYSITINGESFTPSQTIVLENVSSDVVVEVIFREIFPIITSVNIEKDNTSDGVIAQQSVNIIVKVKEGFQSSGQILYTANNEMVYDINRDIIFLANGEYTSNYSGQQFDNFIEEVLGI